MHLMYEGHFPLSPLTFNYTLSAYLTPSTNYIYQAIMNSTPNTSSFLHTVLHPQTLYLPSNHEFNPQHLLFSDYFGFYEAFQTIGTPTRLSYYHPSPTIPGQPQCHCYISLAPLHYFSLTNLIKFHVATSLSWFPAITFTMRHNVLATPCVPHQW